jgi:hypothetical protein
VPVRGLVPAAVEAELPLLGESFVPSRVGDLFTRTWGMAVRGGRLVGCRYEPGVGAITTHVLELDGNPVIGAVEVTATGRRVWRCEEDPELPGLRVAGDAALMAERLRAVGGAVEGCVVQAWRYRPGQRAVLRYEVATPTGTRELFGKVLRAGADALARRVDELHGAALADPTLPFVPALEARFDDLGLVLQAAVDGVPLHRAAFDHRLAPAERGDAFLRAGATLAALHRCTLDAPEVSARDDVAALIPDVALAAVIAPDVAGLLAAAYERAVDVVAGTVDPPAVLSHGALRTDQVVLVDGRPTLLDLDGVCRAPAARDVGNLLAYLRWRALRRPEDAGAVQDARRAFLAGYGPLAENALTQFEALSLLKIAGRRIRNLTMAEWPLLPDLVAAAMLLLEDGPA